jgi:DNA-binding GntR family transcriptional regulator
MTRRSRLAIQAETGGLDTVTEATYRALRRAVLTLELAPDTSLPLTTLRRQFAFGPTPLREALARLAGEGLVVLCNQRSFRVAPLTAGELRAVRLQCAALEPLALRLCLAAAEPGWRGALVAAYEAFAPHEAMVGDTRRVTEEWEALHRQFHLALLAGCGSAPLLARISALYEVMDRYRRATLPDLADVAFHRLGHEALLDAALAGRVDAAEAVLREHLSEASGQIAEHFQAEAPA